jgi:hypothetical protein
MCAFQAATLTVSLSREHTWLQKFKAEFHEAEEREDIEHDVVSEYTFICLLDKSRAAPHFLTFSCAPLDWSPNHPVHRLQASNGARQGSTKPKERIPR